MDEQAPPPRKWVWVSTADSYARGTPSVLAGAEVILALWLYWWAIPNWFHTDIHLYISVAVAPLLLLRSRVSVKAALDNFEEFYQEQRSFTRPPLNVGHIALGLSLIWLLISIKTFGGYSANGALGDVYRSFFDTLYGDLQALIAIIDGLSFAFRGYYLIPWGEVVWGEVVSGALCGIGVFTGFLGGWWLRATGTKIIFTLLHLRSGLWDVSRNWMMLVFSQDLKRPPELLPDIEMRDSLYLITARNFLSIVNREKGIVRAASFFMVPFSFFSFYFPSYTYRLSLKSTCWFWWPLVFAQIRGRAAVVDLEASPVEALEEQSSTHIAWVLFVVAVGVLVYSVGVPKSLLGAENAARLDFLGTFGRSVHLMALCALAQLGIFATANYYLLRAKKGPLSDLRLRIFSGLVRIRWFFLWGGFIAMGVLLAADHLPAFKPMAEFIEGRYLALFPLLKF